MDQRPVNPIGASVAKLGPHDCREGSSVDKSTNSKPKTHPKLPIFFSLFLRLLSRREWRSFDGRMKNSRAAVGLGNQPKLQQWYKIINPIRASLAISPRFSAVCRSRLINIDMACDWRARRCACLAYRYVSTRSFRRRAETLTFNVAWHSKSVLFLFN